MLGLSIDTSVMTLTWRHDGGTTRQLLQSLSAPCGPTPDAIRDELGRLAASAPAAIGITVTLRRPVAHTRTVRLPRMARDAVERVLARDWVRHIIGVRTTAHTVSGEPVDRGRWRASFAPTDLLAALAEAASELGWKQIDIRTSDDTIAGAVRALAPTDAQAEDLIAVVCDANGPADAFHLRRGAPWLGRRFRPAAGDEDVAAFARTHADNATVVIFGSGSRAKALAGILGEHGRRVRVIDAGLPADSTSSATFAALGTLSSSTLPLRAPAMSAARVRRMRSVTRWLAGAAVAALVSALWLEHWRVSAALDDVRQRRADISAKVSNAVALRSHIEADVDVATSLAAREAQVSRVSAVLAAVTVALPPGTALTALHVAGDSVTVEGEGSRSAAVYEALRAVAVLEHVKLAAPLRQERLAGDVAVEHFAFNAHVRAPESLVARMPR